MRLIVISPDSFDAREIASVREMFARGLERYHVRKPAWNPAELSEWLSSFTVEERGKIVLHGQFDLVLKFGLAGAHWSDESATPGQPDRKFGLRSRACHDLAGVRRALGHFETTLLSPVFPSISKPGYGAMRGWTDLEVAALLEERNAHERSTTVFALGGIDETTTKQARSLGFDGVAAFGAIWRSEEPVNAFEKISQMCRELRAVNARVAPCQPAGVFSISG